MPELPEVETVKNALAGLLLNQTIEDVFVFREKNVGPSLKEFLSIKGEKVLSLGRKGKYLIFHLTNDKVLVGHLRMEGKFFFREKEEFDRVQAETDRIIAEREEFIFYISGQPEHVRSMSGCITKSHALHRAVEL